MKKISNEQLLKISQVLFPGKEISIKFLDELMYYINFYMKKNHCVTLFQRDSNSLLRNPFKDFLATSSMPELVNPSSKREVIIDSHYNIYYWNNYMLSPKKRLK